jgi:hypothetical protein
LSIIAQLRKIKKWAATLSAQYGTQTLIIGDMNLPKGLPAVGSSWNSLVEHNSYPSWGAKIQFDYILSSSLNPDPVRGSSDNKYWSERSPASAGKYSLRVIYCLCSTEVISAIRAASSNKSAGESVTPVGT